MKKKIYGIIIMIALFLPCILLLSACGGNSTKTGDQQNGGSGSSSNVASYRTNALTLTELGYGGISESDWIGLYNNCFYGKTVKNFSANATDSEDEDKGISAWYSATTKLVFDGVVNRLINDMDTTTDDDCNYNSAIENVYYYYGTRTVNEKQYDISVMFYLEDKTYAGITFEKNDLFFCSYEIINNSNPGGGSGSGSGSSGGEDDISQYQKVEIWTRPGDYKNKNNEIIRINSDASILFSTTNKSGQIYTNSSSEFYFKIDDTYTKFESYNYFFIYNNLKYSMPNNDGYTAVVDTSAYAGTYEDSDNLCFVIDEKGNAKQLIINYVIYSKDGNLYFHYVSYSPVLFTKNGNEYTSLTYSEETYTKVEPWERMTDTSAIAGVYTANNGANFSINNTGVAVYNNSASYLNYTIYKRGSGLNEEYALEFVGTYSIITIIDNVITVQEDTKYYKPTPFKTTELSDMDSLALDVAKQVNLTTETYEADLFDKTLLKFTPSQTGIYYFYSDTELMYDGCADAFLYISNNKYFEIDYSYGTYRDNSEFLIRAELTANTTYILALSIYDDSLCAGNYNIYVSQTSPNTFEDVDSFDSLIVDTAHSMELTDEYSYVKFTATTTGKMYFYTNEISNDDTCIDAYLYNDYDTELLLESNSEYGDIMFSYDLIMGQTYVLKLSNYENITINFYVSATNPA